jgi:hypothetical protein
VLELNGVGAEAAHIYDPAVSLIDAYRSLFRQWRIAFEIGAQNRRLGHRPARIAELIGLLRGTPPRIPGNIPRLCVYNPPCELSRLS